MFYCYICFILQCGPKTLHTKLVAIRLSNFNQFSKFFQYTHTPSFNGPFSGTTQVSQYQKGKTNLDFTEARDSEWQWHQLGRMQVCTSLQTDNHASTPLLFFTGRMPFLPPKQQRQSTEGSSRFNNKFAVKFLSWVPLHLAYVATLPCETLMSENKRLTINYKVL